MTNIVPLVEDWPFPLFKLDDDDHILWVNQAAQEWLGRSSHKIEGKRLWDIVATDPDSQGITGKARDKHAAITTRHVSVKDIKAGGDGRMAHLTAYMTSDGVGLSVWFLGPQPRETKIGGQVVTGMGRMIAHELKNPLAGIKGAAQLLRDDVASVEGLALIDLIGSEIDRISRLADRMEKLGDADPEEGQRVNIHEILRQARRIIQSASPNVVFDERYDPSLPHAYGDADTLMQALLNLIKNAAESTGHKGKIRLETSFRSGVRGGPSAKHLPMQIRIIDDGPGIQKDLLAQIFQPFVTTKTDGQGLGLALVSKVAAAHEGIVEVQSVPGRTVFSLLLPAPPHSNTEELSL
ncbi:two-component system sensor histidine kinase NtrB [Litorimonas sp. WD9-15]|uniref:two-component system sensor histidine kinase NtrB n=1 Tax=Litorimonas sp. WD9-15 TaxID=3418716 RepID=UPI003D03DA1B